MNKFLRALVFGLALWGGAFVLSVITSRMTGGHPSHDAGPRTVLLLSTLAGAALLIIRLHREMRHDQLREAVLVGLLWCEICLALDIAVRVLPGGMTLGSYALHIGIGYLAIPAVTAAAVWLVSRQHAPKAKRQAGPLNRQTPVPPRRSRDRRWTLH